MRPAAQGFLVLIVVIAAIAAAAAGYAYWVFSGTLPDHAGEIQINGLSGPVIIGWDRHGIPTIEASSFEDALVGEGYVHAIDRPLQLELRRRGVTGRLSEIAGPALSAIDEEALRFGFRRLGEREANLLDPGTKRAIEAYLRGMAVGLARVASEPPAQCRIAGATLEGWDVADVLALGRAFAGQLSNAADAEQSAIELLRSVGLEGADRFWRATQREPLPPLPAATRALLLGEPMPMPPATAHRVQPREPDELRAQASNAWAVSGNKSDTGRAILVADPHLGYELPALWYMVRLRWPGGEVSGASLPGVPAVLIGHTARLAWSFTAAVFDDADLFLAEVDDTQAPTRYRQRGVWRDFTIESQTIQVKHESSRSLRFPRADDAIYLGASPWDGYGYLLRWSVLENGGLADAIVALATAGNVRAGLAAARKLPGPGLNFVAADAAGDIVHALVGAAPLRRGADWDGRIPTLWSGMESWAGFVPRESMPTVINPPEGTVVSANDKGISGSGPVALQGDFYPDWRAQRIRQLLAEAKPRNPDAMRTILADTRSLFAERLAEELALCSAQGASPLASRFLAWDRRVEGPGTPLLYAAWLGTIARTGHEKTKLGQHQLGLAASNSTWVALIGAAQRGEAVAEWFDDPATAAVESPCSFLFDTLAAADREIAAIQPPVTTLRWEEMHPLELRSPVGIGPLARWFNPPPQPLPGDRDTVFVTAYRSRLAPLQGQPLVATHGSSYRMIATWNETGQVVSQAILPGGQAEQPASVHAFDQLADYAATRLLPLVPADGTPEQILKLVSPGK